MDFLIVFSDFDAVFVTHSELRLQKTNEEIRKKGEKATFRFSVNKLWFFEASDQ